MAAAYPELERAGALIVETLRHEETRCDMLGRGLRLLEDEIGRMQGQELPAMSRFVFTTLTVSRSI